jgi:hypothetical protein
VRDQIICSMPYEREDTKEMENICGPFTRKEMYLYIV